MSKMVIKGVKPWDGTYELDEDRAFNAREWRWIKKISDYGPLTLQKGFKERDPELFVALCVIAMCRDGRIDRDDGMDVAAELEEAPFDFESITLVGDETEDDTPLELTSEPDESSPTSSLENKTSSGELSPNGSGTSDATLPPTIPMRSVTSSA